MKKTWKTYKLGEIAELKNGFAFKSSDFSTTGIPVVKIKNITPPNISLDDAECFGGTIDSRLKQFLITKGDILISMTGSHINQIASAVGKVGRYQFEFPALLNQRVGKLYSRDETIFNNDYFYYFISRPERQVELASSAGGSANQANISPHHIKNLEISLPPIEEQKNIANILSSIDDKIQLNDQMNHSLEDLGQLVFKEWFVNFKYKGTDNELANGLPRGWRRGKLGEVIDVKGGTTPSTSVKEYWDGEHFWSTPKDLSNLRFPVLLETERRITIEGVKQISSGVLPKGTLLLSSRAPIGYLAIAQVPISINQGYIAIQGKSVSNLFMLFWLRYNMEVIKSRANGSTFQEISKSSFKEIDIIIPEESVLKKFDEAINPLFERIVANVEENRTLNQLRDSLLPKLMSGKIEIKE